MTRFPGGTSRRWEKIAQHIQRPLAEVIKHAKDAKSNSGYKNVSTADQGITGTLTDPSLHNSPHIQATPTLSNGLDTALTSNKEVYNSDDISVIWTQDQQRQFEAGLAQYPKGTAERWEKIADLLPAKTKDDCLMRFKELAALVKARKQQTSSS